MGINSFQLKCIAIISMVIDHMGAVLFPQEIVFRIIGRIAFPIFCFQVSEGFFHTRDVRRYMARLGIFAVISEIPFDLALHGKMIEMAAQNVFFTLTLGVFMMYLLRMGGSIPVKILEVVSIVLLADFLHVDYGGGGILLILLFYLFHGKKLAQLCMAAGWNLMDRVIYGSWQIQCYGVFAVPFLAFYNGERGRKMKYFFYLFYPAHLLVLYFISNIKNEVGL